MNRRRPGRTLGSGSIPDEDAPVRAGHRYLGNRLDALDYPGALALGLPIGSGMFESGLRHVLQARLKKAGTAWLPTHADRIEFTPLCVSRHCYGLVVRFPLLSTRGYRPDAVTFSYWPFSVGQVRDSHPAVVMRSQAHWKLSRCPDQTSQRDQFHLALRRDRLRFARPFLPSNLSPVP